MENNITGAARSRTSPQNVTKRSWCRFAASYYFYLWAAGRT